jgi:uncharacterized membrane protein YiaA
MDVLAPVWFEAFLAACLIGRWAAERWLAEALGAPDLSSRRRTRGEYVALLGAGVVIVGLLRTSHVAAAAVVVGLVVVLDLVVDVARSRQALPVAGR